MRLHKSYDIASFKALPDEGGQTGRFEAIVSVFGNVDFQGDRVMPGAFQKSIQKWRDAGDPIPIIWSHEWGNPDAIIGSADPNDVEEVAAGTKAAGVGGLLVRGQIDTHKPFAAQVYDLMKRRIVKEFSFAYDVVKERQGEDKANELHVLDLIEAGPTLKGANPQTELLNVKSGLERAARRETDAELLEVAMQVDPELAKALMPRAEVKEAQTEMKMIYAALEGSWEYTEAALAKLVQAWADGAFPPDAEGDAPYVRLAGTFNDRVDVEVCFPDQEAQYFEFAYAPDDTGTLSLGAPASIGIDLVVTAKSDPVGDAPQKTLEAAVEGMIEAGAKAGRVIGAKALSDLKSRIDEWASEVNGQLADEGKSEGHEEPAVDDGVVQMKARLDALAML